MSCRSPTTRWCHGKGSLINKMPGSYEEKFRRSALLPGLYDGSPGKEVDLHGREFGQFKEWDYESGLDWLLLDYESHRMLQHYVASLNHFYLDPSALWENDFSWDGFSWIAHDDYSQSVIAFRRIDHRGKELIAVCNFTPVRRDSYSHRRAGPRHLYGGVHHRRAEFGGGGDSTAPLDSEKEPMHGWRSPCP